MPRRVRYWSRRQQLKLYYLIFSGRVPLSTFKWTTPFRRAHCRYLYANLGALPFSDRNNFCNCARSMTPRSMQQQSINRNFTADRLKRSDRLIAETRMKPTIIRSQISPVRGRLRRRQALGFRMHTFGAKIKNVTWVAAESLATIIFKIIKL